MAEQTYIDFISGIISDTKDKKLNWRYLDSNESLYKGMNWTNTKTDFSLFSTEREKVIPNFNTEDSFYTNIGDMYIVIYVWKSNPAVLYVVPNTYKKVVSLNPEEYGEYITRLLNLVQNQFPNADSFISKYVDKNKK